MVAKKSGAKDEMDSEPTQKDVASVKKKHKTKKPKVPAPKVLLKSTPVDEDSATWSEDSFESDELELTYDEAAERKDQMVILSRLRRIGYQKKIWRTKLESYSLMIGTLMSLDVFISAFYGMRRFGVTCIYPLSLCVIFGGAPLMYLELALGQYTGGNSFTVFSRMAPVLGGIGYLSAIMNSMALLYDTPFIAMTISILRESFSSFSTDLTISTCWNPWNDLSCRNVENPCKDISKELGREYISIQGRCVQARDHVKILEKEIEKKSVRERSPGFHFLVSHLAGADDKGESPAPWPQQEMLIYSSIAFLIVYTLAKTSSKTSVKLAVLSLLMFVVFLTLLAVVQQFDPMPWMRVPSISPDYGVWFRWEAWTWALIHTCILLKLGEGPLITLGAMHHFHNNILGDTLIMCAVGVVLPYLLSIFVLVAEDQMLNTLVGWDYNLYQTSKAQYWSAHTHSQFATWSDAILSFFFLQKNGLLFGGTFSILTVFVYIVSKIIRLESLLVSLVDYFEIAALGGKKMMARLILMIGFIFMHIRTPNNQAKVHVTYIGSGIVILCEVIGVMVFYGPKRLYCNLNLMMFGLHKRSKNKVKSKLRELFNAINVIICFLILTTVPMYAVALIVCCLIEYEEDAIWKSVARFGVAFLFVPVYAGVKIYLAWKGKRLMIRELQTDSELWGPREANDRKKAEYSEKQLRL